MPKFRRSAVATLALVTAVACLAFSAAAQPASRSRPGEVLTAAAGIRHVFVIMLENKNYSDTFEESSQDPYLQKTLVPMGALLTEYYGTAHVSLDNYIALISGQAGTPDTDNDCFIPPLGPQYVDMQATGATPDGQVVAAHGCIYPRGTQTLADQLDAAGRSWKAYMEDMGNDPARESATCGHPPVGGRDGTSSAEAPSAAVPLGDGYATRHNPFMYFHSIIDSPSCNAHVVNIEKMADDLNDERTTPNFSLISPNLCNDAHDGAGTGAPGTRCANGDPGGLTSADAFLARWVPKILGSRAYQKDGLLIITFDESESTARRSVDESSGKEIRDFVFSGRTCCHQPAGPNLASARPGAVVLSDNGKTVVRWVFEGYGGDRVGAVLLSPFVKPGSRSTTPYNHYSLLRSLEDIFRLGGYLGYAAIDPGSGYVLDTIGNDRQVFEKKGSRSSRRERGTRNADEASASPASDGAAAEISPLASLGRKIFFDASLSASGRLSCAQCHDARHGYGPPNGRAVQLGGPALVSEGLRAVPSLRYTLDRTPVWHAPFPADPLERYREGSEPPTGGFGWDGRFDTLHEQAAFPLLAANEMANAGVDDVAAKLRAAAYASDLRTVFGEHVFDDPRRAFADALLALERFELEDPSFHPFTSKYDAYLDGKARLTEQERRGLALFDDPKRGNCASCHPDKKGADGSHPLFTDFELEALGVPRNPEIGANANRKFFDMGLCGPLREDQAEKSEYCGLFKTPTLRNVAARGAFFHNGRLHMLEDALRFYASRDTDPELWYTVSAGGETAAFDDLPPELRGNVDRSDEPLTRRKGDAPVWSAAEIDDVLAFLNTLTDQDVIAANRRETPRCRQLGR